MPPTHQVLNQTPRLVDYDLYAADPLLGDAVEACGGGFSDTDLSGFGRLVGSAEVFQWGIDANRFLPDCGRTTPMGTGWTRSSTTRLGTTCSTWR